LIHHAFVTLPHLPFRRLIAMRVAARVGAVGAALTLAACAGSTVGAPPGPADASASEAEWRALALPRPPALEGAVRISLTDVELPATSLWSLGSTVSPDLALSELVIAGLLRRRDLELVERRRFNAAVDAERAGTPRPAGAPPAGVSRGAELLATVVWLPLGAQVSLEVRLTRPETGAVVAAQRRMIPADSDPVAAARAIVSTILGALDELGRRPAWDDPGLDAAPTEYRPSGVPAAAVGRFLQGLAAEERWNWEAARRSYQAVAGAGFFEAEAALARTARLRTGGTLGES
jgi:hypothetical protein